MNTPTTGMLRLHGDFDLVRFVQEVYDLSRPQGMGYLDFKEGKLTTEQAQLILNAAGAEALDRNVVNGDIVGNVAMRLDYVAGRACKVTLYWGPGDNGEDLPDNGEDLPGMYLDLRSGWRDHSEHDLVELCRRCGIPYHKSAGDVGGAR